MDDSAEELVTLTSGETLVCWRRNARARRVSLRIDPTAGHVVVTLPPRAGRAAGMALLATHALWVADRLSALPDSVTLADGAELPLHGALVRIRHQPGGHGGAWLEEDEILVSGRPEHLPRRVGDFLRREARRSLVALTIEKARTINESLARVSIKDTRSRWGSCSPDKVVMYSWRLVMAPPWVQDYVAAHEVAHLRHLNHGARFWALVAKLTPHTDAAVAWLHTQGPALLRVG